MVKAIDSNDIFEVINWDFPGAGSNPADVDIFLIRTLFFLLMLTELFVSTCESFKLIF